MSFENMDNTNPENGFPFGEWPNSDKAGWNPDEAAGVMPESTGIVPGGDYSEIVAQPFGVERFDTVEPQFIGDPPPEYVAGTYDRYYAAVRGENGVLKRYDIFRDREVARYTDKSGRDREFRLDNLYLEYETGAGRADIRISNLEHQANILFTHADGKQSYRRYYVETGLRSGDRSAYGIIRRATLEPSVLEADLGWLPANDLNLLKMEAILQQDQHQYGFSFDPAISEEEAAYVFDEVIAHARPPIDEM